MRHESRTVVSTFRHHFDAWRKQMGWSRETAVDAIVQAHTDSGAKHLTGIEFSDSRDAFERVKANADRMYRWFDDVTKDTNHIPINFFPSILAALPMNDRTRCMDEVLAPLGMEVRVRDTAKCGSLDVTSLLVSNIHESAEAQQSLAALQDGATDAELERAIKEVTDQRNAADTLLANLHSEQGRRIVANAK